MSKLEKRLKENTPLRIMIKKTDGAYKGYIENSFNMDWSQTHVLVYWSGKAYSMLGEHELCALKDVEYHMRNDNTAAKQYYDFIVNEMSDIIEIQTKAKRIFDTGYVRTEKIAKLKTLIDEYVICPEFQSTASTEVYDPLDPNCPVLVDLETWANAETKWARRNAPFKIKENMNAL